jgi:FHS family L-fucose permease-like MFS transporter
MRKFKFNNDVLSFCDLPEITEEALADEIHEVGIEDDAGPFYKQYRCVFGWVAQTAYVFVLFTASSLDRADGTSNTILTSGAQVGVASFAVNYLVDQGIGISQSRASNLFSYCQMTFTAGR